MIFIIINCDGSSDTPTPEEAINQSNRLIKYVDRDKITIKRYEPTVIHGMDKLYELIKVHKIMTSMEIEIDTSHHHVKHGDEHNDLRDDDSDRDEDSLNINSDQDYLCSIINTSNKTCIQFTISWTVAL